MSCTLEKIYQAVKNKEGQEDLTAYMRPCAGPVHAKVTD